MQSKTEYFGLAALKLKYEVDTGIILAELFKRPISSIDDFKLEDIEIRDYLCHKTIKANMVV